MAQKAEQNNNNQCALINRSFGFRLIATLIATTLFSCSGGLASAQQAQQAPQQRKQIATLAVVNGQPITRHQIAQECMQRFGKEVLEDIVNKLLVLEECKKKGITITEKDVNDDIIAKAKSFGMSAEKYVQTICGNRNITVDRLKNDVIWNNLALRSLAAQQIQVTPAELAERMEFEFGAKVQVRQIVLDSMQQASQIHRQLATNPANFERLAKKFSVDLNSKSMGGLLPSIRRNSGLPEFENIAFALQPGQVSNVFPIADKFIIIRCERHEPAEQLTPEQQAIVEERLVEEISSSKLGQAASNLFAQLEKTAKIVNVMNDPHLAQQMPGVAAQVNGVNILKNKVGEECIARFGKEILDMEINRSLLLQALKQSGLDVASNDVDAEIARAAEALGHLNKDGSVSVDNWLRYVTNNDNSKVEFYIKDEVWPTVALKKLVEQSVQVTQDDMDKGFEANFGPRVEVLVVMSHDHRSALKVWNMASSNATPEFFGKLANQYSIEPASKNNFGEVPPIQKHGGRPQLEKEAFGLQPGEISQVVQVGDYWVVMFCKGRTNPVVTDFDAVKDELFKNIKEKKMRLAMAEAFRQLRDDAQIDNYLVGTSQPGRDAVRSAKQMQNAGQNAGRRVPFSGQRR